MAERDGVFEIDMRRRHDPGSELPRPRLPNAFESALFEDAQEFQLAGRRQLPDLVEKERPLLRRLEASGAASIGARKGPLRHAVEFRLEKPVDESRTIYVDEGFTPARTRAMKRSGDRTLAGPRLSGQQDGARKGCGAANRVTQTLHGGADAIDCESQRIGVFIRKASDLMLRS
jgi:hypothetical protein